MTYVFKVYFKIDSDIPGDSCMRTKTVYVEADNLEDACEDIYDKFAGNDEYIGYDIFDEGDTEHSSDAINW